MGKRTGLILAIAPILATACVATVLLLGNDWVSKKLNWLTSYSGVHREEHAGWAVSYDIDPQGSVSVSGLTAERSPDQAVKIWTLTEVTGLFGSDQQSITLAYELDARNEVIAVVAQQPVYEGERRRALDWAALRTEEGRRGVLLHFSGRRASIIESWSKFVSAIDMKKQHRLGTDYEAYDLDEACGQRVIWRYWADGRVADSAIVITKGGAAGNSTSTFLIEYDADGNLVSPDNDVERVGGDVPLTNAPTNRSRELYESIQEMAETRPAAKAWIGQQN